ncbi:hypothetical protein VMCG_04542 [Cytospora schulzeri]|uniref:Uncharacterized protein n=1 Tax=Cytospora schulzeri TaxID=448051 RepID=A0A423WRF8_9PEZI|nr:hypothetical protein VMCG_04542 [Valsa malicola]
MAGGAEEPSRVGLHAKRGLEPVDAVVYYSLDPIRLGCLRLEGSQCTGNAFWTRRHIIRVQLPSWPSSPPPVLIDEVSVSVWVMERVQERDTPVTEILPKHPGGLWTLPYW